MSRFSTFCENTSLHGWPHIPGNLPFLTVQDSSIRDLVYRFDDLVNDDNNNNNDNGKFCKICLRVTERNLFVLLIQPTREGCYWQTVPSQWGGGRLFDVSTVFFTPKLSGAHCIFRASNQFRRDSFQRVKVFCVDIVNCFV